MLLLEADWLVLPGGKLEKGPVWVSVEGQEITAVFKDRAPPTTDHTIHHAHLIAPGFVDIHTHGVGGSDDILDYWLYPEYTQQTFPKHGTTSLLATTIFPQSHPHTSQILSRLAECMGRVGGGAVVEGVHAEGPIVNDLGAMPVSDAAMPLVRFEQLLDSIPSLRVMTISPHVDAKDGYQRIQALLKRDILPALGHDRVATEREVLGALSLSPPHHKMHITHLFNVCSFHHRAPSLVNFGLAAKLPNLPQYEGILPPTVELVGDMAHVHPMVVSMVLKARSFRDVCFVSDSVTEPRPGAVIKYNDRQMQVSEDGRTVSLLGESVLAGSCCTLEDTLHNLVNVLEVPVGEAVAMLSENPARIAGLGHIGTVEKGKRADLLLLNEELNLQQTIIAGQTEFKKYHHETDYEP